MKISLYSNQDIVCSVCIANYNGANLLEACLDSVFRQDFPHSIEVIVHDDASTDGSVTIVTEKYPAVRLLKSKTNVGFCVSNNRMVAVAKGKFILLLNNDAELRGNALSVLYNYTVQANVCGVVGLPQYSRETGELLDMGSLFDPFLNPIPNQNDSRRDVGMVIGACMWLSKQLWEELGGFPEWFESLAEDMYLYCRARLKGYPVIALAASGFDQWVGSNLGGGAVIRRTLQTTYRQRALSERNKSYVMFLCYPVILARVLVPPSSFVFSAGGSVTFDSQKRRGYLEGNLSALFCGALVQSQQTDPIKARDTCRRVALIAFYSVYTFLPQKLTMLMKYGVPTLK